MIILFLFENIKGMAKELVGKKLVMLFKKMSSTTTALNHFEKRESSINFSNSFSQYTTTKSINPKLKP